MPRNFTPAVLAEIVSPEKRPALFLQIVFHSETVWLWNGIGPKLSPGPATDPASTFPYGQTFIGMGWLGQIQSVPEVADVVAQNVILTLSGIPVELVTDAISAVREDSTATLWLGMLDKNTNQIIGDPVQIFQGHLDVPTITEGAETCSISITAENPLIDLNRAPLHRYTDIDQQVDFPGDTGFFQVQLLQDYNFTWPAPIGQSSVDFPPPNFLTIEPGRTAPVCVAVGGTVQLTGTQTANDNTTRIVMGAGVSDSDAHGGGPVYSTDRSIATVDSFGLVTGVKPGMVNITKVYVVAMFLGQGANKPSSAVTATVTIIVTAA